MFNDDALSCSRIYPFTNFSMSVLTVHLLVVYSTLIKSLRIFQLTKKVLELALFILILEIETLFPL